MRRRPVLRILLNAATVLSLVLCVVTVAAWVRSYQARDSIGWALANRTYLWITTCRGGVFVGARVPSATSDHLLPPGADWEQSASVTYAEAWDSQDTFLNRFGFALDYFDGGASTTRQLACPYWFIVLLAAILPGVRLAGRLRRRARRLGMRPTLCRHCGYDCRATPERCPECGTTVVTATTPAREGKGETEGV